MEESMESRSASVKVCPMGVSNDPALVVVLVAVAVVVVVGLVSLTFLLLLPPLVMERYEWRID